MRDVWRGVRATSRRARQPARVLGAAILGLAGLLVLAEPVGACAVCYGAVDAPQTDGVNAAILTLLGVVALVQVGFIALFWSFRQHAKRLSEQRRRFHLIEGGVN